MLFFPELVILICVFHYASMTPYTCFLIPSFYWLSFFWLVFLASDIIPYPLHFYPLDTRSCTYSRRTLKISFTFSEVSTGVPPAQCENTYLWYRSMWSILSGSENPCLSVGSRVPNVKSKVFRFISSASNPCSNLVGRTSVLCQ